jgi:hypothetical protein
VRSSAKTIDFYRAWQQGRWRFFSKHEQDVFNLIKHEQSAKLDLAIQFLDTTYISGFCQLNKDLNKICTLHANCCVGLGAKMHDLRGVLNVWRNYTAGTPEERRGSGMALRRAVVQAWLGAASARQHRAAAHRRDAPPHLRLQDARPGALHRRARVAPRERRLHRMRQELPRRLLPPWRRRAAARGAAWLCWCRAWEGPTDLAGGADAEAPLLQFPKIEDLGEGKEKMTWCGGTHELGRRIGKLLEQNCVLGMKIFLLHNQ